MAFEPPYQRKCYRTLMPASSPKRNSRSKANTNRQPSRAKLRPKPPSNGNALPASAFPTAEEMAELGRFADQVASGKLPLTRIKL